MNEENTQPIQEPEVEIVDASLMAIDRAQVDSQIETAKKYPRSITQARQEALSLATLNEEVAASCFYSLPRGGKTIEGPSARLAEIIAYSWKNIRSEAVVVGVDDKYVEAMGTCLDLERNTGYRVRVKRRITDKRGNRFNDDMIGVTANAAISIALRNAVFKVVPRALWDSIYDAAQKASLGSTGTIAQKRTNALQWFTDQGMNEAQVCSVLDVKGVDDIGEEQLITLRGLRTAIKDGETTVAQILAKDRTESDGTAELNKEIEGDPDMKSEAETSELQASLFLERLDDVKHVKELDNWKKKHTAEIDALLPEHRTLIEAKEEELRQELAA